MSQNLIRLGENVNSETISLPVWGLEIFCRGDMKKNLIRGRLIKRLRNVVNPNHVSLFLQHFKFVNIGYEINLHFIPCFSNRVVWALVRGYMILEFRSLLQKWDQSDVDPPEFKRVTRTSWISNFQPCNKHQVLWFFHSLYNHTSPKNWKTDSPVSSETPSFPKTVTVNTNIWD